jgi:outer membrane protein OmpU
MRENEMKKILFASTALVATAGIAAAEVDFSGEAGIGFTFVDDRMVQPTALVADPVTGIVTVQPVGGPVSVDDWQINHYVTLSVSMTGETDGGLSFGADFDITTGIAGGAVDSSSAYVEGGFGKFSAGDVGSAVDAKLGLSDIGYDGIGTDNVAEALVDAADAGNMMYEGTFGDFAVALSYDFAAAENLSIAATYNLGDYEIGVGYDDWGNIANGDAFHVKLGADIGDFAVDALFSRADDADITAYALTAAYTMGAATVTAAYSELDIAGASGDAFGLGVAYDLGGGASINAGVGEFGGTTVADMGLIMTF